MQVVFRTDASVQIGTGHVMRCLTLADNLRKQGAECQFICREHEGHLIKLVAERGYQVNALPKPTNKIQCDESNLMHACWLGVDWSTDAQQTQSELLYAKCDWLIVDHYALDYRWELVMQSSCRSMMVIDDLADRRHNCDLLLDQNYGSSAKRYASLLPTECEQLHGPHYALLRPIYAKRRAENRVRSGKVERALIYFGGGADRANLTGMALRAFQILELSEIALDIVIGASYLYVEELEMAARTRGRARIYTQLPDLSELMSNADLAIGAGGATTWERCCLGLPSVIVGTGDNQRLACEALAADGLVKYVGGVSDTVTDMLTGAISRLVNAPSQMELYSKGCSQLVDGCGTSRVIKYLYREGA